MKMGNRLARLAKGCSTSYPIAKYASGMPSSRFHLLTQTQSRRLTAVSTSWTALLLV